MTEPSTIARDLDPAALKALFDRVPYAKFIGLKLELKGDELTAILPYQDSLIGNPMLPALHGGVVAALMELTAVAQITLSQPVGPDGALKVPKTIDVSIDYLRSGRPVDTFARAHVTKLGRRIANVRVEAWQGNRADPIAALHGHFLIPQDDPLG
ncbi:MAG: PaaI family thioesterase [Hyphomonadaceae bacterium]|jgi:uncharacterized protein (TIGR00369 family)|nr:PaaI family thioesterase [Hyphomonadaceae bacterium]